MLSSLKPVFVLALLAAGVVANDHSGRHSRHHAIAARNPAPEVVAVPAEAAAPVKKRSRKTCRPRSATSSLVASSAAVTSSAAVSSSAIVTSSSIEVTTSSEVKTTSTQEKTTSSETPSSTSTSQTHHTTHTEAPPPPPPSPTPTPTPSSTYTPKPKPTTTSDDNNNGGGGGGGAPGGFMSGTNTGDGTWYNTGLVACGKTYQDTDYIAAISYKAFQAFPGAGANPNLNPICGRKIRAHYQGKSVEVALVDECMGCEIEGSIDFTPAAFSQLADMGAGRIHGITWEWV